jgi:transposase
MINAKTKRILATAFAPDSTHDFQIFKRSGTTITRDTRCLADSGYQGLTRLHANAQTPFKKSKLHPLTPQQKATNRLLACERIAVEHVIAKLKVFRILSERYRNRRKRFSLRFNLIAAIYNLDCTCPN